MRSLRKWVPLAILCALLLSFGVQAGGKGAVTVNLYEAEDDDRGHAQPTGVDAGDVVVNTTSADTLQITVQLKDGVPDTPLGAYLVPRPLWGPQQAVTTNGSGKATLHFEEDIPGSFGESVRVKVVLRNTDSTVIYTTGWFFVDRK